MFVLLSYQGSIHDTLASCILTGFPLAFASPSFPFHTLFRPLYSYRLSLKLLPGIRKWYIRLRYNNRDKNHYTTSWTGLYTYGLYQHKMDFHACICLPLDALQLACQGLAYKPTKSKRYWVILWKCGNNKVPKEWKQITFWQYFLRRSFSLDCCSSLGRSRKYFNFWPSEDVNCSDSIWFFKW